MPDHEELRPIPVCPKAMTTPDINDVLLRRIPYHG
jgi:hypothetical protein